MPFKDLCEAKESDLLNIDGVGVKGAQSVITWLATPSNQVLLERLRDRGVSCLGSDPMPKPNQEPSHTKRGDVASEPADGSTIFGLEGKTVVMTGTLKIRPMKRTQFQSLLAKSGATLGDRVGKDTDLLVVADKPGMIKVKEARKDGVMILDEEQFWEKYPLADS